MNTPNRGGRSEGKRSKTGIGNAFQLVDMRPLAKVSTPGDDPGWDTRRLAAADANADDAMRTVT
jgi:hypothetical protein